MNLSKLCRTAIALASLMLLSLPAGASQRGGSFSLSGSAQIITGGTGSFASSVDLTSNCGAPYSATCFNLSSFTFSDLDFTPRSSLTVSGLTTLSTDYNFGGADCGGGSPRIAIQGSSGTITCGYFGYVPSVTGCYTGWLHTGNWASTSDTTVRWDNGCSGTVVNTWSDVLSTFGTQTVTEVDLIVDGGWVSPRGQDLQVDHFKVNNSTFNSHRSG